MDKIKSTLIEYAQTYNTKDFIKSDPIQFPHQYHNKQDIEISAFISSWLAYGNRTAILKTLIIIHKQINKYDNSPFQFIKKRGFQVYENDNNSLYRFYKYNDFYNLCNTLYTIYIIEKYNSLEEKLSQEKITTCLDLLEALVKLFKDVEGVPINTKSACKRLCMMLRWLVRNDNIVDLGIWSIIKPQDLIIPLDTHVHKQALLFGLTRSKQANMKTALEITSKLKTIFPLDPTIFDFSLFGYGVNNK